MRCPEGHTGFTYRTTRGVIRCRTCGEEYARKWDAKREVFVPV